jgi:hypothetical protein
MQKKPVRNRDRV